MSRKRTLSYKERKAQGLCVRCCGKHGPLVTTLLCEFCRIASNKLRVASKARTGSTSVQRWKASGLCVDCGGKHGPRVTMTRCQYCNDKQNNARDPEERRRKVSMFRKRWIEQGLCQSCGGKNGPLVTKRHCEICSCSIAIRDSLNRKRLRDETFEAYGGYRCYCCGETEPEFLTIDHIDGNGEVHRNSGARRIDYWLRKHNYPPGFRVACYNCNCSAGKTSNPDGKCPHQRVREMQPEYMI